MGALKHEDITRRIPGAAPEVHKFRGNGFQEVIYQRALAHEFSRSGLCLARDVDQEIFYKDRPEPLGSRRADFVVECTVLVEVKAIGALDYAHVSQALNYLKAYRPEAALLINFGGKSLAVKRLALRSRACPAPVRVIRDRP